METEVTKRLFTVDEYYRMGEAGIFGPEARLEIIEGEIIEMSPIGNRHAECVNRANALFSARLGSKVLVSVQNPILLNRHTELQPDIVLAKPRDDFYAGRRIAPEDTLLVVEVSDATLRYDLGRKLPLYAKSGVPEVWIENLQDDVVMIYRRPGPATYSTSMTLRRGESIVLDAFPEIPFQVDELLG
jgi:Uma2 family endonuclease